MLGTAELLLWSVELEPELMEPVELLVLEFVPAWLWSLGVVVVVVVVVWLPLGLFWVCDIEVLLLGVAD